MVKDNSVAVAITETKQPIKAPIDINKLVKKAQDTYGKKEQGLAKQLSTGKLINRPKDDKDYVVWQGGTHWEALTGIKGIPFGKVVEISGKPDSGKSSHALCFMKYAQDQNVLVILWDSEGKFSSSRFDNKIGGNSDQLLIVDTNTIIDGAKAVAKFVHTAKEMNENCKILIVWDSVGASLNSSEDSEENEDYSRQPGQSAKENSYAIKKFVKLSNKYMNKETGEQTIAILAINQTYSSIMGPPSQIEKGGQEIYYLSSIIIQLNRKKDLTRVKGGDKYKYGIITKARSKKNHLFDSTDECLAEVELVVSADGIKLAKDVKGTDDSIKGWSDDEDSE